MTDADRLLAAAQMLEITGFSAIDADPSVKQRENRERNATAALLRAVAARHVSDSDGERCYGCREPWPCPEAAAAEALADVILGDNDD